MTITEMLVTAAGLAFGYWMVSDFLGKKAKGAPGHPDSSTAARDDFSSAIGAPLLGEKAWFDILQVSPSAGPDEIRAAFRKLISQYHPDKVSSLGEDLQLLAEAKSKDINIAYRAGMAAHGISV